VQVAVPFGTNVGGVNVALFQVNPLAQFDSWVTVGETLGNANNDVSSIGIDFTTWSDTVALVSATDSGGAVFWMDPDKATAAVSAQRTMVVAQLTLRDAASQFTSQIVHFDAQGRSTGHPIGTHSAAAAGPSDWEENCIEVLVGGSQNGQGSHSVLSAANAPLVMGGECVMLTNPKGGSWQYNQLNFGDGTAATLQCMGGFYAPAGAQMQKMCHNGQWAGGATAQCMSAQPCTAITPYPVAGQYTYSNRDYIPGSRATLTCTAGWYLSNDNVVKVCQSGVWVPDTSTNPGNTAYNFAMCSNTDARGPGGLYDANGHLAVTVHCQDKRTEYFSDTCFIEPISHDQRTQVQCSAMGSKCRWVVDLTTDGTPGGAHGTTCQHCASTVQGTPPPSPPPTPPAAKSSSGGTVFVVVLVILLAGGGYVAFDKKLGPFAPKTERTSSLTDPGGGAPATIYDKQTDDSL